MKGLEFRKIAALFLIGLLTSAGFTAQAESGNVVMSENNTQITLKCDEDLFSSFKNMMPGQTAKQVIQIANTGEETLSLYLRAENAQLSDFDCEEKRQLSQELIEQCQLTVNETGPTLSDEKLIYSGPASGKGDRDNMTANVSLGSFQTNSSAQITATLTVPQTVGNRYQNAAAKVRWIFIAEGKNKTVEVPISPKTGDESKSTVIFLLALCAFLVFILSLAAIRRK